LFGLVVRLLVFGLTNCGGLLIDVFAEQASKIGDKCSAEA
jgi:hypothetical protein